MKTVLPPVRQRLQEIARAAIAGSATEVRVTPWMTRLPGWRFISKRPLLNSALVLGALFILTLATVRDVPWPDLVMRTAVGSFSTFLGFYGVVVLARCLEQVQRTLRFLALLPDDVMARWFVESVAPFMGSVNLLPAAERADHGWRELLRRDRTILVSYVLGSAIAVCYAVVATRAWPLPADAGPGHAVLIVLDVVWALSFMWTAHAIPSLLGFIWRIGKLPLRTFLDMPDSLSLKAVGGVFLKMAWCGSLHLFSVLLLVSAWGVLEPMPGESQIRTALIVFITLGMVAVYMLELVLLTIGTQVVLSRLLLTHRERRQAEHAFQLQRLLETWTRTPSADSFKRLDEAIKQGRAVFSRLPRIGLGAAGLVGLVLMLVVDGLALWLFVSHWLGGDEIAALWRALGG